MYLEIVTPDKKVYQGEVTAVQVPGIGGSFEILNNHAPIVSAIEKGNVRVKTSAGEVKNFTVEAGVIEVVNNKIALLAEAVVS